MNKDKEQKNAKRIAKREDRARKKRKQFNYFKNIKKNKINETKRENRQSVPRIPSMPLHKKIWMALIRTKDRLLCLLGFHAKTLQSGLPGTPKYMCRRCLKNLKEVW